MINCLQVKRFAFLPCLLLALVVAIAVLIVSQGVITLEELDEEQLLVRTALKTSRTTLELTKNKPIATSAKKPLLPQRRVVHLDLKGAPPKLTFLAELFPLIREAGGNALLIEYEDMFPYEDPIQEASSLSSYSKQEITELLALAAKNSLEVIPLVQTFGHMEHVLKVERFSHLREASQFPESICPSKNESVTLIKTMLDQVMQLHKGSVNFIHIGCDEVFHLASCSQCAGRLGQLNRQRQQRPNKEPAKTGRHIFLEHVKVVAKYVRDKYSIQPLIWDDMLRSISVDDLRESGVAELVEPVVWAYGEDIDAFIEGRVWQKYSYVFPHVWAASAFKGAFGERLMVPEVHRHFRNNLEWLKVIHRESHGGGSHGRPITFRGLMLTGWSRYDHFAVLCELLPTSVPSLVVSLLAVSGQLADPADRTSGHVSDRTSGLASYRTTDRGEVSEKTAENLLNCPFRVNPESMRQMSDLKRCRFPGSEVFEVVVSLQKVKQDLEVKFGEKGGWMTAYNVRHNFTSTWRLSEPLLRQEVMEGVLRELEERARAALAGVFHEWTVSEWIEQNIQPIRDRTNESLTQMISLMSRQVWPRRPLPP